MNLGGDDEDGAQGTEPEVSTTGQGTEGQDGDEGQLEDAELSAEQPDDEEAAGEQGLDEAARQAPSRGETRIQRLANEAKAAREEAAEARREAAALRRSQEQASQHLTEQQERERLALMTPEERMGYVLDKSQRDTQRQLREMEFRTQNLTDKAAFDAKASIHPTYAKYQEPVEAKFQELLSKGTPTDRETILKFMLGERALQAAGPNGRSKAAKTGQSRVAAQTVKPGSAKGDTASQRAKAGDTPEKRLAGQYI